MIFGKGELLPGVDWEERGRFQKGGSHWLECHSAPRSSLLGDRGVIYLAVLNNWPPHLSQKGGVQSDLFLGGWSSCPQHVVWVTVTPALSRGFLWLEPIETCCLCSQPGFVAVSSKLKHCILEGNSCPGPTHEASKTIAFIQCSEV